MANFPVMETCCCGASIQTEAWTVEALRFSLSEWRREHRHESVAEDPEKCPICGVAS